MGTGTRYRVAINSMELDGKIKDDSLWSKVNGKYQNKEVTLIDLANDIYMGRMYAPWFSNNWRHIDNFICAQFIAVDLDTEDRRSTFEAIRENPFFCMYGSLIHTTPSHKLEAPRARAIFLLDAPIFDAEGYRKAIRTVYSFFPGSDPSCIDPSRGYFGNAKIQDNFENIWIADNTLPLPDLRTYYKQLNLHQTRSQARQYTQPQRPIESPQVASKYAQRALEEELATLANTREGGRNVQLNRTAYNLGTLIADGLLPELEVVQHIEQAARSTGLPASEVTKTLRSGLHAGMENPRGLLQ